MAEPYTSEDYERAWGVIDSGQAINFEDYGLVSAALRMAARVTDGTIERTVAAWLPSDKVSLSARLQAALTGDQS